MSITYKDAGVDIQAGDALVDWLKETTPKNFPHKDKLASGIGGFAAVFRMQFPQYKKPVLVSSTDGIGTKVKVASHFSSYASVGQDLVAMCVNDLVCCGARPLFFLDYYATSKLHLESAKEFLGGVRAACYESDCALIGGETAEMPGVYQPGDFDAAGFCVGIGDEDNLLGPARVSAGSKVIGVESSGFHSNGFSLIRKAFEKDFDEHREILLKPTHLYVKLVLSMYDLGLLQAVANITGSGMENLPRVMPDHTCLKLIDWSWPKEFVEVQDRTALSRSEMLQTLNCGVGLALFVAEDKQRTVHAHCQKMGFKTYDLGEVEADLKIKEAHVVY